MEDKVTKKIFDGVKIKRIDKNIIKKARRRLELINAAKKIEDLYFPPSNNFHSLEGHKPTRYSIRINSQWRVSFEWRVIVKSCVWKNIVSAIVYVLQSEDCFQNSFFFKSHLKFNISVVFF